MDRQTPRTWRITAYIPYPMEAVSASTSASERLECLTRIRPSSVRHSDISVSIRRSALNRSQALWAATLLGHFIEPAELSLETIADSDLDALRKVEGLLEDICDDLAFRLQLPLQIRELEILDATPPLAEGDLRQMMFFPSPQGFKPIKFMLSAHIGSTVTERSPGLITDRSSLGARGRAALRWYHKALATECELDRFVFYWIVLEILCAEIGKRVKQPYRNRICGHTVENCPSCGAATSSVVNGPTLIAFLRDLGLEEATARVLWGFRQMFHGANDLAAESNEELSKNCMRLRGAVTLGLKRFLGWPDEALPSVSHEGFAMSATLAPYGFRELRSADLGVVPGHPREVNGTVDGPES